MRGVESFKIVMRKLEGAALFIAHFSHSPRSSGRELLQIFNPARSHNSRGASFPGPFGGFQCRFQAVEHFSAS